MKKKYFLGIDTETAGDPKKPYVYDIGVKVFDLSGQVYEKASWVIYDIYAGQKEMMDTAYYAKKLPRYEIDLANGTRKMVKFSTARWHILKWMKQYNIEAVVAYNTAFDRRALNNTLSFINGKRSYFFPFHTQFYDIWNMAASTFFQSRSFMKTAYENNWVTEKGNVSTSAETAYRFISKNYDFEESHTALEDVDIEQVIFLTCWHKTKDEHRQIIGNPWKKPQKDWAFYESHKDGII